MSPSPPRAPCPFCPHAFSTSTQLVCHLAVHDQVQAGPQYECRPCDRNYHRDLNGLLRHLADEHTAPHRGDGLRCRSCGRAARDADELARHVAADHVAERARRARGESGLAAGRNNAKYVPAVCGNCSRTFSNKYNLAVHARRVHRVGGGVGERHECGRCGRRYSSKGALRHHARLWHEGRLPHTCALCGERMASVAQLERHRLVHDPVPRASHVCHVCGRAFIVRDSLRRHAEVHFARAHACHVCERKFRRRAHLSRHLETHRPSRLVADRTSTEPTLPPPMTPTRATRPSPHSSPATGPPTTGSTTPCSR